MTIVKQGTWRKKNMEIQWNRKKTYVAYLVSMPFLAALFVYWTMNAYTMVGTVSLLLGSIILYAETESYLREVLQRKKEGK
jgi:uncharacterized membrane protein